MTYLALLLGGHGNMTCTASGRIRKVMFGARERTFRVRAPTLTATAKGYSGQASHEKWYQCLGAFLILQILVAKELYHQLLFNSHPINNDRSKCDEDYETCNTANFMNVDGL